MMQDIALTCVSCGKKVLVGSQPEEKRDRRCSECGNSLIEQKRPGNSKLTT